MWARFVVPGMGKQRVGLSHRDAMRVEITWIAFIRISYL